MINKACSVVQLSININMQTEIKPTAALDTTN
jgi:hypothetical protein